MSRTRSLSKLIGPSGSQAFDTNTLVIDAANNRVGIGTAAPASRLDVLNGTANTQVASFSGADAGGGLKILTASTTRNDDTVILKASDAFGEIAFTSDNTEVMRITKDNNVGIGETVPVAKLHIQGSGTSGQVSSSLILENSSSGTVGLQITGAAGSSHLDFMYGGGPGTGTNTLTTCLAMTLEGVKAGNIGIGTDAPDYKLHVKGAGHQRIKVEKTDAGGDADISIAGPSDSTGWVLFTDNTAGSNSGVIKYVHSTNKMHFRTNDVDDRLVISDTGKVGIGTSSPSVSLDINSTDAIRIPVGTTAQRPSNPAIGYLRLNTTSNATEIFKNGSWSTFAVAGMITSGLRLHWDMTNSSSYSGSGTSITDLSGNGYTGTIVGNPTYSTNNSGYLVFDGSGDRITSTMTAPSGARTFGMWVYYTSTTQNQGEGYQLQGIQASGGYTYLGITDGGNAYFYIGTGSGGTISYALSAGNWYYQALTFDGTNYAVYVNGVSIQTGSAGTGTTGTTFSAGAISQNHHLYGYGAEWQFYDKGLTSAEVLQNFNAGKERYGL